MGPEFGFSSAPRRTVKNDIFKQTLIKSPETKRCCSGRFILGVLKLTTSLCRLVLGTNVRSKLLAPKKLEPKTKCFVSGDFMVAFKMIFLTFLREVEENKKIWTHGF